MQAGITAVIQLHLPSGCCYPTTELSTTRPGPVGDALAVVDDILKPLAGKETLRNCQARLRADRPGAQGARSIGHQLLRSRGHVSYTNACQGVITLN